MIKLSNVSKAFKNKSLFEDVSFEIGSAGLYAVSGSNGSGKTTLLKMLHLKERVTSGKIENSFSTCYADVKNLVFNRLTVWENLEIICADAEQIEKIIEDFYLAGVKNQNAKALSMGEKVRLAVARALLLQSEVILLDEPTANLDETNRKLLLAILKNISKTRIIIFSTNQASDLQDCDSIISIKNNIITTKINAESLKIVNLKHNLYTDKKLLKKALGGYGIQFRIVGIFILLLFSLLCSLYLVKENDLIYHSYNFNNTSSYLLIENEYFKKEEYTKIDKSSYDTQPVKSADIAFFLDTEQIKRDDINKFRNIEIATKIPKTLFVHYSSLKYTLADNEIAITKDLYDLFEEFSLIRKGTFYFKDLTFKIAKIEPTSKFSKIENMVKANKKEVDSYIDTVLNSKDDFDLASFIGYLRVLLYQGCPEADVRSKDIENSHIYLNHNAYKKMYQAIIESLNPKDYNQLKNDNIIYNQHLSNDSSKIIVSTAFWEKQVKYYRLVDIFNGIRPLNYEIYPDLIVEFEVAGYVETDEEFICFLDDSFLNIINEANIKKDFEEIIVLPETSRDCFDDITGDDLALVGYNYHKIKEILEIRAFITPALRICVIALAILLIIFLLLISFVPILQKRKVIILLVNSCRTEVLKKEFVIKIAIISMIFLMLAISLSILLTPTIAFLIYKIWSFDLASIGTIIVIYFVGYLWMELTQKGLFYYLIKQN